jgi:hypothetical protein
MLDSNEMNVVGQDVLVWTGVIWLRIGGTYEHGNETSGSI